MDDPTNYWQHVYRSRLNRRKLLKVATLGGAGLTAAVVVGCADERPTPGVTPTSPTASPESTTVTPTAPTSQPKPGGTLRVVQTADLASFDPQARQTHVEAEFFSAFYSRLFRIKEGATGDEFMQFKMAPDLAESVEIPDLTTYRFTLRPGVKFHDIAPVSGREVTVEDVKASFERVMDPENKFPSGPEFVDMIDRIETPDQRNIIFRLKAPNAWFVETVADDFINSWILPMKEVITGTVDFSNQMVIGTGPFIFEAWERGVEYRGRKNPTYHFAPIPWVDNFRNILVRDAARRIELIRSGDLDIGGGSREDIEDLTRAIRGLQVDSTFPGSSGIGGVTFQSAFPGHKVYSPDSPFNDIRVRRAVSLALDRDAMFAILRDDGVYQNFVPAGLSPYWIDPKSQEWGERAQWWEYNPERAKQLMAEAGWERGTPEVPFSYTNAVGPSSVAVYEAMARNLADIGVRIKLTAEDHQAVWIVTRFRGEIIGTNAFISGNKGPLYRTVFQMWSSRSLNHAGHLDPKVEEILDRMRAALSVEERKQTSRELQEYMTDQMYAVMGVATPARSVAQPRVKDFRPQYYFCDFPNSYMWAWLDRT